MDEKPMFYRHVAAAEKGQEKDTYRRRQERLRKQLAGLDLDAALVTGADDIGYLTGFPSGARCHLVVREAECVLLTGSTEYLQALEEALACRVEILPWEGGPSRVVEELEGCSSIGFDPGSLNVLTMDMLSAAAGDEVAWRPTRGLVRQLMAIKELWEIELIREACSIFDAAMDQVIPTLKVGVTELEIGARLDFAARQLGSEGSWFPTIVATGPRSSMAHAPQTGRRVGEGDLVKIDMGPNFHDQPSDATRTLVFGPASEKVREVYDIVLEAQLAGIEACGPGVPCADVDRAARRVIKEAGYGAFFTHSLGHGLGGPPLVGGDSSEVLEPNMVVTIEPGIYLEGWGGVRIEDSVLITEDGCEVLHAYPKELVQL